ncbi:GAF domain-containing protein [Saccharopolyspora thermophila]|uniref:GAF domain-containing protein n=1 Tax=Saccharopolyspora thermophila TaxID=89367 RepID=A0ABN1D1B8_9PSEU|nr:GAF domain-containing protein [Saccharopolyspora subtropica]
MLDRTYRNSTPALLARLITAVPGADMACISGPRALALHTDERARRVDLAQLRHGAGPCVEAARSGRSVLADITQVRLCWPGFARSAREARIFSFLVVPLLHNDALLGTLSLYAQRSHAFTERDETTAQLAIPAICAALLADGLAGVAAPVNGYQVECSRRRGHGRGEE